MREAVYDYNKTAMRTCVDQDHEAMLHDIIRLPSEASVDYDHEAMLHDIIKLPHEVRVDHDHELQVHDIIKRRAGAIQISGAPALYIHDNAYEVLILFISL